MSRALALLCVFGCLYGVLADICNQTDKKYLTETTCVLAPSAASAQDRPLGPGKVEVQFWANSCTENVTCTLCPPSQTAKPLDARFKENGESTCIFTNLAQNVHYTVKFACSGTAVQQKKIDYYFNSEPVRSSPVVSTWSRSANIMMEAFCIAMKVDIGYMMVNIRGDNMDTSCVVFPTCDYCNRSLCRQKCDEQPGYINITLPLDNLRPSTDYTFDLSYIYCDLNTNIITISTLIATTGAGDPVDVTNISATSMGSRSVTVTWTLPSPDPANYTLYIRDGDPRVGEAGTGCDVDTTLPIIIPWNVTTCVSNLSVNFYHVTSLLGRLSFPTDKENSIQGPRVIPVPHPFWQYQVAVVMSTETGNSTPQWVTVRTLPESPGAVSHLDVNTRKLVKDSMKCGNAPWESYNDVCVMWEEVCPRERGDNITTYEYSLSNGDTHETDYVNCKPGDNEENHGMRQDRTRTTCSLLLPVDTGSSYTLCNHGQMKSLEDLTRVHYSCPSLKPGSQCEKNMQM
ncbi:hypothetical protein C0Q70_11884 [Pomacea canaliculata]|uniref:Fibronectin type-III domain-containing protein n=1 Tax=Pomacea canaliculata TaxID=400727 RepID=A0A2T7P786_POMCA|nr:hypothetical protein C0Q70_11884 [Pomacea canaliculata]